MERIHLRTCPLQEAAFVPTQDTSDGHPASVPAARLECLLPPRSSALLRPPSCWPPAPPRGGGQTPRAQPPEPQGVCLLGHPDHGRQQLGDVRETLNHSGPASSPANLSYWNTDGVVSG